MDNTTDHTYIYRRGGSGIPTAESSDQGPVVMVSGERHTFAGLSPGQCSERDCRRGIPGDAGQVRLDALSTDLPATGSILQVDLLATRLTHLLHQ